MFLNLSSSAEAFGPSLSSQRVLRERLEGNIGRLSSGLKIRRASDGPAAMVASDFLRARVRSLEQANENLQTGSNFLAVAEGALQEVSSLLVKLRELAIRAANFVDPTVTAPLQEEADAILQAIDRIGATTRSGRTQLFDGAFQRSVSVLPLSTGGVGAIGASVPDYSTLGLGFHELTIRGAGGVVTNVDTSAATVGLGEEGKVTDGGTTTVVGMNNNTVVFTTAGGLFAQNMDGLDATILNLNPNARTNLSDIRIGPDDNSVVFEADHPVIPGNRSIFQVSFAGVETQLAGGTDDRDLDVTSGVNRLAFTSPILPFPITPNIDDVDALAVNRTNNNTLVVDNDGFGGGGGPVVQEYTSGGTPIAGPISLAPFFAPGASITGMAHAGGNDFFVLDGNSGVIRRFTIAGGAIAPVGGPIVLPPPSVTAGTVTSLAGTASGTPGDLVGFDPYAETAGPAVVGPIPVPETITLSFLEDPDGVGGTPLQYTISGSLSGVLAGPTPFVSGAPITVNGVQFTLGLTQHGVSRGVGAADAFLGAAGGTIRIQVDGGATPNLPLAGPRPTGQAVAAEIEANLALVRVTFDPASSRYIVQSISTGAASSVVVTPGVPPVSSVTDELNLGLAEGGLEASGAAGLGLDVVTGDAYSFTINSTGVTTPTGLAFDGVNLFVGDAATGMLLEFNTFGVQQPGAIDFGSLGAFGNISRFTHDPAAAGGDGTSFYVLDNAGNIVEIDDNPAPGTINAVVNNSFAQVAPGELGIGANGTGSLFLGQDIGVNAGGSVRQIPNTGGGAGAAVFLQDIGTMAITQIAIGGLDPEISRNGTRVAYISGANIETTDTAGGSLISRAAAGVTSIDDVSVSGRFVAYRAGAVGSVIDMNTGAITATGNGQEFSPTTDQFLYYETGGEIFRLDVLTSATVQLTGPAAAGGPKASGSADFAISPNGLLLAYTDAAGEIRVINADGTSAATVDLTDPPTPNPTGGASPTFSPSSALVNFRGNDIESWVRGANDVNIPVLPAGGAFSAGPVVNLVNTIVQETFTIQVIAGGDVDGADSFSVTGSVSGFQGIATAGVAFTTPGGVGGLGAGLAFTIRQGGQYAVGTTFLVDTNFVFGASLDGGPEVIAPAGQSEILFSPDGEALEVEFGSIRPVLASTQAILVEPGGVLQANTEIQKTDQVPFHIDALSSAVLDLFGFSLEDFAPRIAGTEVRSTTLTVLAPPTIVDFDQAVVSETLKVEFNSATTFSVTGSVSGPILQNQTFVPGTPIVAGNVQFTLGGAAAIGDEVLVEVENNTALVDQAIDKISRLRSQLGSKIQEVEKLGRANSTHLLELLDTVSTIADLDFGAEIADLTRNQVLTQVMVGLQAQANFARESILALMQDNLTAAPSILSGEVS